jgi:hypothetical protein
VPAVDQLNTNKPNQTKYSAMLLCVWCLTFWYSMPVSLTCQHNAVSLTCQHNAVSLPCQHNAVSLTCQHNAVSLTCQHNAVSLPYQHNAVSLNTEDFMLFSAWLSFIFTKSFLQYSLYISDGYNSQYLFCWHHVELFTVILSLLLLVSSPAPSKTVHFVVAAVTRSYL